MVTIKLTKTNQTNLYLLITRTICYDYTVLANIWLNLLYVLA